MNIVSLILTISGLIFFFGGAIGIIRLPDFYTRLHAAGKLDTAGLLLTMSGLAVYTVSELSLGSLFTAAKIMFIVMLIFITSPTATHAIIDAGFIAGLKPWTKQDQITARESEPTDSQEE